MLIGLLVCLTAAVCYLFLLGASRGRDWEQEDREQAEYLREYALRRRQRRDHQETG